MRKAIRIGTYLCYIAIVLLILPEISLRLSGFHGEGSKGRFIQHDD